MKKEKSRWERNSEGESGHAKVRQQPEVVLPLKAPWNLQLAAVTLLAATLPQASS